MPVSAAVVSMFILKRVQKFVIVADVPIARLSNARWPLPLGGPDISLPEFVGHPRHPTVVKSW